MSQGHPWARAHWRTSRCPFSAAHAHVSLFQGHPWARAHWRTVRCPFMAAYAHRPLSNSLCAGPSRAATWPCSSGRTPTGAPGTRRRARVLPKMGTLRSSGGRGPGGAPGTNGRARGLPKTGTSRSSSGRGPMGALGEIEYPPSRSRPPRPRGALRSTTFQVERLRLWFQPWKKTMEAGSSEGALAPMRKNLSAHLLNHCREIWTPVEHRPAPESDGGESRGREKCLKRASPDRRRPGRALLGQLPQRRASGGRAGGPGVGEERPPGTICSAPGGPCPSFVALHAAPSTRPQGSDPSPPSGPGRTARAAHARGRA